MLFTLTLYSRMVGFEIKLRVKAEAAEESNEESSLANILTVHCLVT